MDTVALPADYAERVYAGVLGKVIGVYLGRPFEGATYEQIQERLGDIEYYVHDRMDVPLIVTDDDISGTFTFLRALNDHGASRDLGAEAIGKTWLNYLIENKTILWWGGLGNSTEHTAYLRLKSGIPAPRSGSAELNGQVVAEQIGAQIFIDGWAMVSPGNPDQAARLATAAASVSHDGEAIYGAVVLAVMESMAFVEDDLDRILDKALSYIPTDSIIARLITDIRSWHAIEPDWRATRESLAANYGYDKYGGNCHMVPNHGLIIHSLLHGNDDFSEALKIVNTCGWDTDCNSGNVGCFMGIKNGLAGIDAGATRGADWRGPVADRIYLPTADGGRSISDCAREALEIVNLGRALAGEAPTAPKGGAEFHFAFPGAVQGFRATGGEAALENVADPDTGERRLVIRACGPTDCGTPVFTPSKETAKYFENRGYALLASPRIYPGQTVTAAITSAPDAHPGASVQLYVRYYGANDDEETILGQGVSAENADLPTILTLGVPVEAHPVFEVGLHIESEGPIEVYLDHLTWRGEPIATFGRRDGQGTMWRRAWVNAVSSFLSYAEPYRLIQNVGTGLLIQGARDWRDYRVEADVRPHLASRAGIAARVQGLQRYYALLLKAPNCLQLVRMHDGETILAECEFAWSFGESYELALEVVGSRVIGFVGGTRLVEATDHGGHEGGAVALVIEEGRTATTEVRLRAPLT